MPQITVDQARLIIDQTLAEGEKLNLKPLSVAVLDSGGHLIAFERQDGASTLRPQIAIAKAAGALAMGVSSRKLADMAVERPSFMNAVAGLSQAGLVPAAGGLVVVDESDIALGAVGVTGDTSDNDEICAIAGITFVNLAYRA